MMTAATQLLQRALPQPHLRPLDLNRDLARVADLVELCFAERLDSDGRRYVRQMRQASRNPGLLSFSGRAGGFSGFVWEEDERLIGNLNLLPVTAMGSRAVLIANVAVHPEQRGRGIARALTEAALESADTQGIRHAWLQVDADNEAAHTLYRRVGFQERARRTTWHLLRTPDALPRPALRVEPRRRADWIAQRRWLARLYPAAVAWHLPLNPRLMDPGLRGAVSRLMSDRDLRHWSAAEDDELQGVLAWQSSHLQADWLWLAAAPGREAAALAALVPAARAGTPAHRKLALDLPAGEFETDLAALGFERHQTLIWMHLEL
ncbi:MAG: GNAT family N-acetyltransferase [Anaerolineae bacterium]|nr:MAG: GNAT family N-acetyltransferase [Anaerolineae bacterium]